MDPRHPLRILAACMAVVAGGGCASTGGTTPAAGPVGAADSDACAFEVVNQTTTGFDLLITSAEGMTRGSIRPGSRYSFERSCATEAVVVTATPEQGPRDFDSGERRSRSEPIERRVAPEPGEVVRISLRW